MNLHWKRKKRKNNKMSTIPTGMGADIVMNIR